MIERIKGLLKDEEGATMVEYALMLALIAVVCILIVTSLGNKVKNTFGATDNAMTAPT
jgi:pilus assembly protein Flp/PilA